MIYKTINNITVVIIGMLALVMTPSCNNKKEEMSMKIEWSDEIVMPDINGKENYGTAGA